MVLRWLMREWKQWKIIWYHIIHSPTGPFHTAPGLAASPWPLWPWPLWPWEPCPLEGPGAGLVSHSNHRQNGLVFLMFVQFHFCDKHAFFAGGPASPCGKRLRFQTSKCWETSMFSKTIRAVWYSPPKATPTEGVLFPSPFALPCSPNNKPRPYTLYPFQCVIPQTRTCPKVQSHRFWSEKSLRGMARTLRLQSVRHHSFAQSRPYCLRPHKLPPLGLIRL